MIFNPPCRRKSHDLPVLEDDLSSPVGVGKNRIIRMIWKISTLGQNEIVLWAILSHSR